MSTEEKIIGTEENTGGVRRSLRRRNSVDSAKSESPEPTTLRRSTRGSSLLQQSILEEKPISSPRSRRISRRNSDSSDLESNVTRDTPTARQFRTRRMSVDNDDNSTPTKRGRPRKLKNINEEDNMSNSSSSRKEVSDNEGDQLENEANCVNNKNTTNSIKGVIDDCKNNLVKEVIPEEIEDELVEKPDSNDNSKVGKMELSVSLERSPLISDEMKIKRKQDGKSLVESNSSEKGTESNNSSVKTDTEKEKTLCNDSNDNSKIGIMELSVSLERSPLLSDEMKIKRKQDRKSLVESNSKKGTESNNSSAKTDTEKEKTLCNDSNDNSKIGVMELSVSLERSPLLSGETKIKRKQDGKLLVESNSSEKGTESNNSSITTDSEKENTPSKLNISSQLENCNVSNSKTNKITPTKESFESLPYLKPNENNVTVELKNETSPKSTKAFDSKTITNSKLEPESNLSPDKSKDIILGPSLDHNIKSPKVNDSMNTPKELNPSLELKEKSPNLSKSDIKSPKVNDSMNTPKKVNTSLELKEESPNSSKSDIKSPKVNDSMNTPKKLNTPLKLKEESPSSSKSDIKSPKVNESMNTPKKLNTPLELKEGSPSSSKSDIKSPKVNESMNTPKKLNTSLEVKEKSSNLSKSETIMNSLEEATVPKIILEDCGNVSQTMHGDTTSLKSIKLNSECSPEKSDLQSTSKKMNVTPQKLISEPSLKTSPNVLKNNIEEINVTPIKLKSQNSSDISPKINVEVDSETKSPSDNLKETVAITPEKSALEFPDEKVTNAELDEAVKIISENVEQTFEKEQSFKDITKTAEESLNQSLKLKDQEKLCNRTEEEISQSTNKLGDSEHNSTPSPTKSNLDLNETNISLKTPPKNSELTLDTSDVLELRKRTILKSPRRSPKGKDECIILDSPSRYKLRLSSSEENLTENECSSIQSSKENSTMQDIQVLKKENKHNLSVTVDNEKENANLSQSNENLENIQGSNNESEASEISKDEENLKYTIQNKNELVVASNENESLKFEKVEKSDSVSDNKAEVIHESQEDPEQDVSVNKSKDKETINADLKQYTENSKNTTQEDSRVVIKENTQNILTNEISIEAKNDTSLKQKCINLETQDESKQNVSITDETEISNLSSHETRTERSNISKNIQKKNSEDLQNISNENRSKSDFENNESVELENENADEEYEEFVTDFVNSTKLDKYGKITPSMDKHKLKGKKNKSLNDSSATINKSNTSVSSKSTPAKGNVTKKSLLGDNSTTINEKSQDTSAKENSFVKSDKKKQSFLDVNNSFTSNKSTPAKSNKKKELLNTQADVSQKSTKLNVNTTTQSICDISTTSSKSDTEINSSVDENESSHSENSENKSSDEDNSSDLSGFIEREAMEKRDGSQTPSVGSNDIVEAGISIEDSSDTNVSIDEECENDSFIVSDSDEQELLSGTGDDLSDGTNNSDVVLISQSKAAKKAYNEKIYKKSRIIRISSESSDDSDQVTTTVQTVIITELENETSDVQTDNSITEMQQVVLLSDGEDVMASVKVSSGDNTSFSKIKEKILANEDKQDNIEQKSIEIEKSMTEKKSMKSKKLLSKETHEVSEEGDKEIVEQITKANKSFQEKSPLKQTQKINEESKGKEENIEQSTKIKKSPLKRTQEIDEESVDEKQPIKMKKSPLKRTQEIDEESDDEKQPTKMKKSPPKESKQTTSNESITIDVEETRIIPKQKNKSNKSKDQSVEEIDTSEIEQNKHHSSLTTGSNFKNQSLESPIVTSKQEIKTKGRKLNVSIDSAQIEQSDNIEQVTKQLDLSTDLILNTKMPHNKKSKDKLRKNSESEIELIQEIEKEDDEMDKEKIKTSNKKNKIKKKGQEINKIKNKNSESPSEVKQGKKIVGGKIKKSSKEKDTMVDNDHFQEEILNESESEKDISVTSKLKKEKKKLQKQLNKDKNKTSVNKDKLKNESELDLAKQKISREKRLKSTKETKKQESKFQINSDKWSSNCYTELNITSPNMNDDHQTQKSIKINYLPKSVLESISQLETVNTVSNQENRKKRKAMSDVPPEQQKSKKKIKKIDNPSGEIEVVTLTEKTKPSLFASTAYNFKRETFYGARVHRQSSLNYVSQQAKKSFVNRK